MAIDFNCSKCGQRNVVAGTLAGKSVRCRECGAIVRVPAGQSSTGMPPAAPSSLPPQPGQTPPAPATPRPPAEHLDDSDHVHPSLTSAAGADTLAGSSSSSLSRPAPRKNPWQTIVILLVVIGAGVGIWYANRGNQAGGPAPVPTARINPLKLAQSAPEPAYQRLVNCWLSELTIRDSDTSREVKLWIYLPLQRKGTPRSVGCVFLAAGGPGVLPGSRLLEDQREECLALVKADFAVVAYDVEGAVPKPDAVGPAAVAPLVQFMAADGGLADARLAIEYVQFHVREVDPLRWYAAGAGSSGTVALLLAASESRISGCAVRAPLVDLATPLAPLKDRLNEMVQDASVFLVEHSPSNRIASVTSPVWVFHAADDTDVPVTESYRLNQASVKVTLDEHAAVGDPIKRQQIGLSRAITWLEQLDDKLSRGLRSTSRPGTRPAAIPTQPSTLPKPATQPVRPVEPVEPEPETRPATQPVTLPASRPMPAPASQPTTRPDVTPPPVDPTRQRLSDAAARLINLGANVRLDPTGQTQTSLADLADVTDPTKAAEHIPALGKVAIVHLTARQTTAAIAASLKTLPSIALLDIDAAKLTDAHLEYVGTLTNVEELSLLQASVGTAGLKSLAGMTGLKKLNLRAAKIDDAACESLGKIASLKTLDLSDTPVTGDGIAKLKTLKNLVTLRLKNTQVTQAAIDDLRATLPRLNIIPP